MKNSIQTKELNTTMDQKLTMFANRLNKVHRHRSKLAKKQGISCFRLYDLDMPEFPFCIDIYEDLIYVAEYRRNHTLSEDQHKVWLTASIDCIAKTLEKPITSVYLKERKVIEDRQDQYHKLGEAGREHVILENGLQFIINLNDYLDTGLFLDHRLTRKMVGEISKGKRVLNLFAYTASFSVYAAAHGAEEVVTIDLSNTYINWAKRNFEINKLQGDGYKFIVGDVMQLLPQMKAASFDIIVCDPPTFSNSKKMVGLLDTQRDHVAIINDCLRLLTSDGVLFFSTNYSKFKLNREMINSKNITDITRQTTPFDFEGKLDRYCFRLIKDK